MKLLIVSHEYNVGGATRSLINLILELKKKGNQVDVLIPRKGKAEKLFIAYHLDYKIIRYYTNYCSLNRPWKLYELHHELFNYIHILKLAKYIHDGKYDYVISNSSAFDVAARACELIGQKHVYYIREFMEEDFGFQYRNKRRMKRLIENSAGVIFISNAIRDKYVHLYNINHFIQVYDGINVNDYIINDHDILKDRMFKFISVGTICEGKGTLDTVKYIEKIKTFSDCRLTIVGNTVGEYFETVQNYVNENGMDNYVSFAGYTTNVKNYLAQSDILIMNSRNEGLGRVTIEAMMAGCLVIGRASGGTLEIIEDGTNGLLYRDENEFLAIVRCIIKDPNYYRRIAEVGRKYAINKFDPQLCADSVLQFLIEIDGVDIGK